MVDAGYLDNFGMSLALSWVRDYVDPIDAATERVVILEIRPYGLTDDPQRIVTKEENKRGGELPDFVWPLEEWTTPLEGGETARRAGMVGRNNANRDLLVNLQDESDIPGVPTEEVGRDWRKGSKGKIKPFRVSPIRFKGNLETSLNWTLSKTDIANVHDAVDEIFMPRETILAKHSEESESYLRWRHNNSQYVVFRELFKDYFPLIAPTPLPAAK